MSVQTKEVPAALGALLKAKGQNMTAQAQQPVAIITETTLPEVAATSEETPEVEDNTPNEPVTFQPQNPESTENRGDGRDSPAYKELKQHYDMTVHQLRTQVNQLETQLSQASAPKIAPPKTKEEVAEFKKQYGDAYDIMRTIVLEEIANNGQDVRARIEQVDKLQKELVEKEAFKKLLEEHPDALEIRQSPKFAAWYAEQPEDIKIILSRSTDIKAVSKQLTLYKLETGIITQKTKKKDTAQKREDASLGVDVKSQTQIAAQKKIWTGSEIRKICANHKEWRNHAAEIDQARREGRVDMTK